ncbi:hypothetical protein ACEN9F_30505 [Duganella sp. CT11-25]|uniref:hypothetical protein n=1 Tax=unclassified Duganella TaxID=2636909 RepID=UPI0039B0A8EE
MIASDLWPLFTATVGVACWWGGNRQALGRDVRKEWNAQVEKIRVVLDRELRELSPDAERPGAADIDRFEHMLSTKHRAGFRNAVERYQKAHDEHTYLPKSEFIAIMTYEYSSTEHIKSAIHDLLSYLPYRK